MKSALYIEDGVSQIILTPESAHEKNILKEIESKDVETTIKIGNFRDCQGGWVRYYPGADKDEIDSLMIVLKEKRKE